LITFDKLKWHCEHETFPKGLPRRRGGVYGAPFLCWVVTRGYLSTEYRSELSEELAKFESGALSPLHLYEIVGAIDSEMLTVEALPFAYYCFESEEFDYYGWFEDKYCRGLVSPYELEFNNDALEALFKDIDSLFENFRNNTEQQHRTGADKPRRTC